MTKECLECEEKEKRYASSNYNGDFLYCDCNLDNNYVTPFGYDEYICVPRIMGCEDYLTETKCESCQPEMTLLSDICYECLCQYQHYYDDQVDFACKRLP